MISQWKRKSAIGCLILSCLTFNLGGCSTAVQTGQPSDVTLLEPVGVAANYETVVRRNMYDAKVFPAYICPKVTEYSFGTENSYKFSKYGSLPGEEVKTGDMIVYGDTVDVENRIKSLKEEMANMKESHEDAVKMYNETIKNLKSAENAPALEIKKQELAAKEEKELFELDYKYKQTELELLNGELTNKTLTAKAPGTVMSTMFVNEWNEKRFLADGDWVGGMNSLIAVGDTTELELRCEFMNSTTVAKAKEVYAIIDGKRYEVEYQAYEAEEYQRLMEKNKKVYATFKVKDMPADITSGTFATLVLVKDGRQDVLTISRDAVTKEESGSYVYLKQGEESKYTHISTGFTDGTYVEVVSGLNEGDQIVSEQAVVEGGKTQKIERGKVEVAFSSKGYLVYPSFKFVTNPVTYGTCYFDECLVAQNQQVKKGDVLARIHVKADATELKRIEKQLSREKSRLEDLKKAGAEQNKLAIEMKQDRIADLQERLTEMRSDAAVKEITSPISGIIIALDGRLKEGDLLSQNQAVFQVADESLSYIMVDDANGQLNYGNTVEVTYLNPQGQTKVTEGSVVSLNHYTLSQDLVSDKALIKVSAETLGDMAGSSQRSDGWWSRVYFDVKATVRTMDNVLLVPKRAVTERDGETYVKLKREDGSVMLQSFISGGADNTYYWVADGLTEGMEICLE